MSLRHSRKCVDLAILGARSREIGCPSRILLSGLILTRRCYASTHPRSAPSEQVAAQKKDKEEVMRDYEVIRMMSNRLPVDPWAQPVPTMDLHIPSLTSHKKNATLADNFSAFTKTMRNWFLNVVHMRRMAQDKGFPGVKVKSAWSTQIFAVQSTKDSAWIAPLRRIALDTYRQLNQAAADRDEKTIKQLSIMDMQAHYLKLARTQDPSRVFVWKFHGERSPCRVVSVRAVPTHMGQEVPGSGSRLLVQALVKFDTLQSLEVYSKKGRLLHGQSDPRPVVEYLVFQKRMWYDTPWTVRDQLYEGLEGEFESAGI